MTTNPPTRQLDLFAPEPTTADEAQSAAAQRKPRPGSPREWTERVAQGLCGVCGQHPRQSQPDANQTILQSTSDQYCRPCFRTAVANLAARGITRAADTGDTA